MDYPTGVEERLVSDALFTVGGPAVHANLPRHEGHTPLHDHDFWEAAVVLAGVAVHRSVAGSEACAVGDVVVLQPGQWHAWEGCRGLRLANLCLGRSVLERELSWAAADPRLGRLLPPPVERRAADQAVLRGHLDRAGCQAAARILRRMRKTDPQTHGPAVLGLTLEVLDLFAHAGLGGPVPGCDLVVTDLAAAVAAAPWQEWSLRQLAARAGCAEAVLVRRWRRSLGQSPMAWLARRRAERAAVLLLTTDEPVAAIGRRVGWPDANYFARRFRQLLGRTPSAYRAELPVPALAGRVRDWVQW